MGATFPIIGIGMSAGGLNAARAFLRSMPADSGAALVVVQHLEPTRSSMLAELLQRDTSMRVVPIRNGMRVVPDQVHVIVPAKTLTIEAGVLRLADPAEPRGMRHPIDRFFTSLAHDGQSRAIGIVLSGSGSNGTAGLLDIKQAGGLCVAQDPATAQFDTMPRNAIESGAVDLVLPPDQMPPALLNFMRHPEIEPKMRGAPASPAPDEAANSALQGMLDLLRARVGMDFRFYKRNTLLRRIQRRVSLAGIADDQDYLALLRRDQAELEALARDLMINVTALFRDPGAWDALSREVVAPLCANAKADEPIRVWVPACSTGEEAYSLAILFAEQANADGRRPNVKIFASDALEGNLARARRGVFAASMVETLSPERVQRFFTAGDNDTYRIKPEVRETVLFAAQNLLTDPPYSKIDLVSCRNLLIYLEPEAQNRVLALAHFALRDLGYLFLGTAETVGQRDHMFSVVSKRWRIWRRIGAARGTGLDFGLRPRDEAHARPKLTELAVKVLAEQFAPASVLIDRNSTILHFHGATQDFLVQPDGAPTLNLMQMARPQLRPTIHSAVAKAIGDDAPVTLTTRAASNGRTLAITAAPVPNSMSSGNLVLVSFVPRRSKRAPTGDSHPVVGKPQDQAVIDEEIRATREESRNIIEQSETLNEELKAANEEITSVNEELQSTNEELEASKEELQSLNEELSAVNAQLERKIGDLTQAGDDMRNLLSGNDVATIFLDRTMRLKWFTPAVRPLFDLVDSDVGRPIQHFAQKFADGDLVGKATTAMQRLETSEQKVRADNGRAYLLRVLPYRTRDDQIAGVAATFLDVTDLETIQVATAEARDYAQAIVETIQTPLVVLSDDLRVQSANRAFLAMFDTTAKRIGGRSIFTVNRRRWDIPPLRALLQDMLPSRRQIDDFALQFELPKLGARELLLNARLIPGQASRPDRILLALEDVTEQRRAAHQQLLVGELSHRVKNSMAVIQSLARQTLRHSSSLDDFGGAFIGRLHALARAHDAVIEFNWLGVPLTKVVDTALLPFQSLERTLGGSGPELILAPQASLALGMILHELATNALKHGAMSVGTGKVSLTWQLAQNGPQRRLVLDWLESGGPATRPPMRRGHGTAFVQGSVAHDLAGEVKLDFRPAGLHATIAFPLPDQGPPDVLLLPLPTRAR